MILLECLKKALSIVMVFIICFFCLFTFQFFKFEYYLIKINDGVKNEYLLNKLNNDSIDSTEKVAHIENSNQTEKQTLSGTYEMKRTSMYGKSELIISYNFSKDFVSKKIELFLFSIPVNSVESTSAYKVNDSTISYNKDPIDINSKAFFLFAFDESFGFVDNNSFFVIDPLNPTSKFYFNKKQ